MLQKIQQIQARIEDILSDDRLSYPTANITVNAPLAFIQLQMVTELHTLQGVLDLPKTDIQQLRLKSNLQPESEVQVLVQQTKGHRIS